MATDLEKREDRVRFIKDNIISAANEKANRAVASVCAREKGLLLNDLEYELGKLSLESTPEGIGIGAHYSCNAKCIFCLGGSHKPFSLQRYKEFFEQKLGHIICRARYLNLCGFGELLLMPGIEEFIDYINNKIPAVNKIYTTNGIALMNNEVITLLTKSQSVVEISLHASNSKLHKLLTRTDSFEQIKSQIKKLVSLRKEKNSPAVCLVFLLNTLNVENLPDFVELASDLGVDEVICNYMTVFHRSHLKLSCFFKQELTVESFNKALERGRKLKMSIRLPPMFGVDKQASKARICSDPWKYFYVENEGSVLPCCFAGDHVGYLDRVDFWTIWNGAHYKGLRDSLSKKQPLDWCKYCYKYDSSNVNDIRSHISSRPYFRDKLLSGLKL
jgi:MoaA/NifB/PqqE/SkfB family radical SAM enzyme